MRKHIVLTIIALLLSATSITAATPDSTIVEHNSMWTPASNCALANPAIHGMAYKHTLTQFNYQGSFSQQNTAFVLEKGKGANSHTLFASTFLRLSPISSAWGEASYTTSQQKEIRWHSISDYELLAPHIIADSIGGNTQLEKYWFKGGYSAQFGNWNAGGEMAFRAQQEYRDYDPRMRSIVSDLQLKAGLARFFNHYRVAMHAGVNVYKQTVNIDFYQETTESPEYFMTGLGSYQPRFSGKKTGSFYQGGGVDLSFTLDAPETTGWHGDISLAKRHYERIANEFNSLPITQLYKENIMLSGGYKHEGAWQYDVFGTFDFTKTTGDEAVPGDGAKGDYPIIATFSTFHQYVSKAQLTAVVGRNNRLPHYLSLVSGIHSVRSYYAYPERKTAYTMWNSELKGQVFIPATRQLTLNTQLSARYWHNLKKQITMPFGIMTPAFTSYVQHNHRFAAANYMGVSASVEANYALKKGGYALFLQLEGSFLRSSQKAYQSAIMLKAGVRL